MQRSLSHLIHTALLVVGVLAVTPVDAREVLITGEWPPYTGIREPQGGSITAVVRQALAAEGIDAQIGFFGWNRVRPLMDTSKEYAGRFPDYYSEERARSCHYSNIIGKSPLGLAELRVRPVHWNSVADLASYRIGTVRSYVNSPEFDQLVGDGKIRVVQSADDEENMANLVEGKVDAALIDRNVYAYLLKKNPRFKGEELRLRLNEKTLMVHRLYVCFSKDEKGRVLRDRFNKGLKTLTAVGPR